MTFLALLAIVVTTWFLYRTPAGLTLCMTGENPMAVESQGLSAFTIRTVAVMAGSALMAICATLYSMITSRGAEVMQLPTTASPSANLPIW